MASPRKNVFQVVAIAPTARKRKGKALEAAKPADGEITLLILY